MNKTEIISNVLEGLDFAIEKFKNNWLDVVSVYLKTSDSPSIPIYSQNKNEMLQYIKRKADIVDEIISSKKVPIVKAVVTNDVLMAMSRKKRKEYLASGQTITPAIDTVQANKDGIVVKPAAPMITYGKKRPISEISQPSIVKATNTSGVTISNISATTTTTTKKIKTVAEVVVGIADSQIPRMKTIKRIKSTVIKRQDILDILEVLCLLDVIYIAIGVD